MMAIQEKIVVEELSPNTIVVVQDSDMLPAEEVKVKFGPPCLIGLSGSVIREDGEFIVVRLSGADDAGLATYDYRMPRTMVVTLKGDVH